MQVLRVLIAVLALATVAVSSTETTEVVAVEAAVDAAAEQLTTESDETETEVEAEAEDETEEESDEESEDESEEEEESEESDAALLEVDETGKPKSRKAKKPAKRGRKFIRPHMHRRGALRRKTIAFPVGYDQSAFRIDTVYADGGRAASTEKLFARFPKADRRIVARLSAASRPLGEYPYETPEYAVDPRHPQVIEYHTAKEAHAAAKKAAKKAKKALKSVGTHATLADISRLERALAVALQRVGQHEARLQRIEAALKSGAAAAPAKAASVPKPVILQATANTAACAAQKGVCQTTTCSGTQVHNLCGAGAAVCCVTAPTLPIGDKGLDISVPLTATVAKCLKSNSYTWISIRAGRSTGSVDTNAPASIRTAIANGFTPAQISVYIFPFSATSDSTSGGRQVTAMWNSLASVKDSFSMIWLDIEKATWSTTANNQKFFESMLAACRATGKTCGVYTSQVYWTQIMGSSYKGGASVPLWYPHYNNIQSLADWAPFGGWTSPYAKQWKGDTTICGVGADLNIKNAAFAAPVATTAAVLRASAPAPAAASSSSVTAAQLVACMTGLSSAKAATVLPFINAAQAQASINTCKRKSAWLAQLGHESGSLVYMQEIASGAAYEGRKDLGNTQPGDGKKYKGRGPIQLTGRANYAAAGKALGLDLINNPTSVATNAVGFKTSAWFWSTHGLNSFADSGAFSTITQRINGGQNGAADRNARYAKCKKALGC